MNELWYQFRKNSVALAALCLIAALALTALFATLIAPYDPFEMSMEDMLSGHQPRTGSGRISLDAIS